MKHFTIIFLSLSFALTLRVQAVRMLPPGNLPDTVPLQPLPEDTLPNLQNNIDFQASPEDSIPDEAPQNQEVGGDESQSPNTAPDTETDGQSPNQSRVGATLLWTGLGLLGIILAFFARKKTPR